MTHHFSIEMSRKVLVLPSPLLFFLLLGHLLCSGSSERPPSFSTTQVDITTPTITPTTPTTTPLSHTPFNPTTTTPHSVGGLRWCVASQSASETALQVALDYACGYGGADCSPIQVGGRCYVPNSVRDHASYAFNTYYHKEPLATSCDFGGTALIVSNDPSTSTCQFLTTGTTTTVLNITNQNGPSTVFSSAPSTSPASSSIVAKPYYISRFFVITTTCIIIFLPKTQF